MADMTPFPNTPISPESVMLAGEEIDNCLGEYNKELTTLKQDVSKDASMEKIADLAADAKFSLAP